MSSARKAGTLAAVSSLPGKWSIGRFGSEAYEFVDFLASANQSLWQILPLVPTIEGNSPYKSCCTFAGNSFYIDLQSLIDKGLLTEDECAPLLSTNEQVTNYEKLEEYNDSILYIAYKRDDIKKNRDYKKFCKENAFWLDDYALYVAIKKSRNNTDWMDWDGPVKLRNKKAMKQLLNELSCEVEFQKYIQWLFSVQWQELKKYANDKGIQIIGDIPIYVALESSDVWAHPELFQLDKNLDPTNVAGVPPDGYSKTGQLWGNPLYKWEEHEKTKYAWWISRISYSLKMYDILRIDHFRGFDEYYSVPASETTAERGEWVSGPGIKLFNAAYKALGFKIGSAPFIAEDLGYVTDSVVKLVKDSGMPNMKVLEFAFDSRDTGNASDYLPHNYSTNCVAYTGTHDNNTVVGWLDDITNDEYKMVLDYLGIERSWKKKLNWPLIGLVMRSTANSCVIPLQDYLGLGAKCRMNTPGTPSGNWTWRVKQRELTTSLASNISRLTKLCGRSMI